MQILLIYTFFILYCSSLMVSMKISPCARWNRTGITVVGTGTPGNSPNQLDSPRSIFTHKKTNVLYVADSSNSRIQMFLLDQLSTNGITVALTEPSPGRIYVDDDDNGPTIYVALDYPGYVEKWVAGASSGVQVAEGRGNFVGVTVDKEKNVYMSDYGKQWIVKWSPQTNTTTVVAGESEEPGSANHLFSSPTSIFFDHSTGALYVTDTGNHRIQKWAKDAEEGVTIAGSRIGRYGEDSSSLRFPQGVLVDDETQIVYVADTYNNRIQKWLPAAFEGITIAGGLRGGNASNQLSNPFSLAFDNQGNLYVCDTTNHRIQLFRIIDNDPCLNSTTTVSETTPSTPSHAISFHGNQLYIEAAVMATLLIVIKINTILV